MWTPMFVQSLKVGPDGSASFYAIRNDRANGQVELPRPTIPAGLLLQVSGQVTVGVLGRSYQR